MCVYLSYYLSVSYNSLKLHKKKKLKKVGDPTKLLPPKTFLLSSLLFSHPSSSSAYIYTIIYNVISIYL